MSRKKKKNYANAVLVVLLILIVVLVVAIIMVAKGKLHLHTQPSPSSQAPSESRQQQQVSATADSLTFTLASDSVVWGTDYAVQYSAEGETDITWWVDNENFATVANGVVTPKRVGNVTVTAQKGSITASMVLNIQPKIEEIDGVTYVNNILIANKTYPLPSDFGGYNEEAQAAFDRMAAAAAEEGLNIYISSGYRPYETQYAIYWREYDQYGFDYVEGSTARPGYSEHQTGLAFDLNTITDDFKDTAEGIWCAQHAHEYGFILRYLEGETDVTGYMYEPWHFRYIGDVELCTDIYNSGLPLETYLGITSQYASNDVQR